MSTPSDLRPTSPHLSIYRWQISSVMSILHRMTGLALVAGSMLLVAWLWAAAYHIDTYKQIYFFMSQWYGRALMIGWTIAFYYHLSNGLRHLWWDTGKGFTIPELHRSGWMVIFFTAAMTGLTWWLALTQQHPIP